jgi:hypothetical protein
VAYNVPLAATQPALRVIEGGPLRAFERSRCTRPPGRSFNDGYGAISLKKSKNRARRKLAKLESDGTLPFNTISDPLRTSHAAQSKNWLVPQLIFECRARRPPRKSNIAERDFFNTIGAKTEANDFTTERPRSAVSGHRLRQKTLSGLALWTSVARDSPQ